MDERAGRVSLRLMSIDLPLSLLENGAVNSFGGTLTSRTLMFAELSALLDAAGEEAHSMSELRRLVVEENVCGKASFVTRRETFRHLRSLYALSNDVVLCTTLRFLWKQTSEERPLLALLVAFARSVWESLSKVASKASSVSWNRSKSRDWRGASKRRSALPPAR